MIAATLGDWSVFVLAVAVAVAIVMVARLAKTLKVSMLGMKAEIGEINTAVNHVDKDNGETTLIQKVREIQASVSELGRDLGELATDTALSHQSLSDGIATTRSELSESTKATRTEMNERLDRHLVNHAASLTSV